MSSCPPAGWLVKWTVRCGQEALGRQAAQAGAAAQQDHEKLAELLQKQAKLEADEDATAALGIERCVGGCMRACVRAGVGPVSSYAYTAPAHSRGSPSAAIPTSGPSTPDQFGDVEAAYSCTIFDMKAVHVKFIASGTSAPMASSISSEGDETAAPGDVNPSRTSRQSAHSAGAPRSSPCVKSACRTRPLVSASMSLGRCTLRLPRSSSSRSSCSVRRDESAAASAAAERTLLAEGHIDAITGTKRAHP